MSYLFMDPGKFGGTWFNNFQQNVFTQFTCQNVSTFTDNRKFRRILPAFLIAKFFLFSFFCSLTLVYRKVDVFVAVVGTLITFGPIFCLLIAEESLTLCIIFLRWSRCILLLNETLKGYLFYYLCTCTVLNNV